MRNPQNDPRAVENRSPAKAGVQSGREESGLLPSHEHSHSPERTCVLTRRKGSRESLIRLALGPDGKVAPDVRARAPGRGAWISVGRAELEKAIGTGKLRAALQHSLKTKGVTVPADLGERIAQALRQAALDRLGMEAKAGNLINGADRVEAAARAGKVYLLIHSRDAGEDGRKRLDQSWRAGGSERFGFRQGLIFPEERTILSMALGRENVVHIALTDRAAASRVLHALDRWRIFIDSDAGPNGGDPALGGGSAEAVTKE